MIFITDERYSHIRFYYYYYIWGTPRQCVGAFTFLTLCQ